MLSKDTIKKKIYSMLATGMIVMSLFSLSQMQVYADTMPNASELADCVVVSPKEWTNGTVVLTCNVLKKYNITLDEKAYSWDSCATWTNVNSASVKSNGSYRVAVKDADGNITQSDIIKVDNIDVVKPVITTKTVDGQVVAVCKDAESGLEEITVLTEDGTTTLFSAGGAYSTSETVMVEYRQGNSYKFTAMDKAGNTVSLTADPTGKENSSGYSSSSDGSTNWTPEFITACMLHTPTNYTNGSVVVSLVLPSAYKQELADLPYSWDGGVTWSLAATAAAANNGDYQVAVKTADGNVYMSNIYKISNIDKNAPSISLKQNGATIEATVGDDSSGIASISWSGASAGSKSYTGVITDLVETINISSDGSYTVKVTDYAGNYSLGSIKCTSVALSDQVVKNWFYVDYYDDYAKLVAEIPSASMALLEEKPFKWGNGSYTSKTTKKVEENGTYSIRIKALDGNVYKVSLSVSGLKNNSSSSSTSSSTVKPDSGNTSSSSSTNTGFMNNDTYSPKVTLAESGGVMTITADDSNSGMTGIWWSSEKMPKRLLVGLSGARSITYAVDVPEDGLYMIDVYNMQGYYTRELLQVTDVAATKALEDEKKKTSEETKSSSSKQSDIDINTEPSARSSSSSTKSKDIPGTKLTEIALPLNEAKNLEADEIKNEVIYLDDTEKNKEPETPVAPINQPVDAEDYKIDPMPTIMTAFFFIMIFVIIAGVVFYLVVKKKAEAKNVEEDPDVVTMHGDEGLDDEY